MALGRHIDMEEFLVATYPGGHILMLVSFLDRTDQTETRLFDSFLKLSRK